MGTLEQRIARILCDPGSQVSFITDQLTNQLHLHRSKYDVAVEGIGAMSHARTNGSVFLTLKSMTSNFSLEVNALVLPSITSELPAVRLNRANWKHLSGLQLADPQFTTPARIDVLLGADVWGQIVEGDILTGTPDEPCAQLTRLGWVVYGPVKTTSCPVLPPSAFCSHLDEDDLRLEDLVRNFWNLEEVHQRTNEPDECEQYFCTTHFRNTDGRYVVNIPFRNGAPELGDSYTHAIRQFYALERRLANNTELCDKYINFMSEYLALNHMERVDQPGDHTNCYYIPHHAVQSKFRVVFNASARSSNGVSLNDIQMIGPTIQDSLVNILLRFRRYSVALTADVEKMFRQILISPEHRDFQRILWRDSPTKELEVFRLTTVTYGMACSPFNAVRTLHQCARDNHDCLADLDQGREARDTILSSFYVDDLLVSCCNISEAVQLATNVSTILSKGGFQLRKWNSNCAQVINHVNGNNFSSLELNIDSPTATVLGLSWNPITDELFFKVKLEHTEKTLTKRRVLSEVAQLFDPTGLLAPVVITGKIFIQTLWSAGLTWDDPLPPELADIWRRFRNGLNTLDQVRVPRWLGMRRDETTTLHGFCDASLRAYAAVIYSRTEDVNGRVQISLVTARTKVAPLKGSTIPRLELCAAHLLAVLFNSASEALGVVGNPYYLWSDSRIVLCWLDKHPASLKPYVSNRVRQILNLTATNRWFHVRSAQNPADCASRGIGGPELLKHWLWWQGPEWLSSDTLPLGTDSQLTLHELANVQGEVNVSVVSAIGVAPFQLTTRRRDGHMINLTERFSSLQRLLHTVAYIMRWYPNNKDLRRRTIVEPEELDAALTALIILEQGHVFSEELRDIRRGSTLATTSRLLPLNPFLDPNGVLRVGGRIRHAFVPHNQRFPAILPRNGALVWLLVNNAHDCTMHGGTQLMLQTLRQRFWILNGRQIVRSFIHRCVICRRHRRETLVQQMASLPKHRVSAARPFSASGVDYCGPFILRVGNKRSRSTVKTYLAIFVCMSTKAVHIEVVEDLSAQAFLDAFTRFVSRRGPCPHLYSDNGTAFVGANRLLKEDLEAWHSQTNQQSLASNGTKWHFITPSAPHQGGLWEAAVKSAKHHLLRLVGTQTLWYNQLQTLAVRIEACLNSRPITPLYDDPDEKLALTPGDFLIGAPLIAVPEPNVNDIPSSRIQRWQWLRQVHQHFWQRWSEEYLVTLQRRSKWRKRMPNIQLGDIVIVRQENLPATHWRLGRVVEIHPGTDGLVRNVTLKTSTGLCTRAVQKLCVLLPTNNFEQDGSTGQDV